MAIPAVIVGGIVVVGVVVVVAWGVYTFYASPHAAQNRATVAEGVCQLGRGVQSRYNEAMAWPMAVVTLGATYIRSSINVLMHKGEYVPSGLSGDARNAYREAIHRYKQAWGIPRNVDVPREICDEIANLVKRGLSLLMLSIK